MVEMEKPKAAQKPAQPQNPPSQKGSSDISTRGINASELAIAVERSIAKEKRIRALQSGLEAALPAYYWGGDDCLPADPAVAEAVKKRAEAQVRMDESEYGKFFLPADQTGIETIDIEASPLPIDPVAFFAPGPVQKQLSGGQ